LKKERFKSIDLPERVMVSELTTPQKNIDILELKRLREEARSIARNREDLEDRTRYNNLIESEKARVSELIPTLPQKLEEAAREGYPICKLLVLYDKRIRSKKKLMQHPAYGELIRYLESQGLTNVYAEADYAGSKDSLEPLTVRVTLYVKLP
jgi:hypothetical protein